MKPGIEGVRPRDPVTGDWEEDDVGPYIRRPLEITAQFTVCGKTFAPVSLVPLLGLCLLAAVLFLIGSSTFH